MSELDEKNSMALAIVPSGNLLTDCIYVHWEFGHGVFHVIYLFFFIYIVDNPSTGVSSAVPNLSTGTTGWELALVTAPSSNEGATAVSKLVCSFLYSFANLCGIRKSDVRMSLIFNIFAFSI